MGRGHVKELILTHRHAIPRGLLSVAEERDAAAHAAELEAKDKRFAELESQLESAEGTARSAVHNAQRRLDMLVDAQRQIVELKAARSADERVALADVNERDKRIAELARRKELPPLPESVRAYVEDVRRRYDRRDVYTLAEVDLLAFVDTHYTKPVPQWELDARDIERRAARDGDDGENLRAIAARIREAHRCR